MKLVKCYVSSFGKIKNYTIDFNDGLNVIKEDNGWGKSTLSMFIKSIFYGLKGTNKHSVSDNERKKYKPWGTTEKFGGYIDFDWNGTVFRIERYFGIKDSDDEVRIINLATGKPSQNTDNLGERIFGIDEDGFFSTTYFSEGDFEITGNTSLTAKYNSVIGVQSSETFDKALIKVENAVKKYKQSRGSKGLIEDKHNEIKYINDEIERANRSLDAFNLVKDEIAQIESRISIVQKEIDDLTRKIGEASQVQALQVKKRVYDTTKEELERLTNELGELDKFFRGFVPDQQTINAYSDCYKDYLTAQKEISKLNEEIILLQSKEKPTPILKPDKKSLVLSVSGGVLLLLGVVLAFTLSIFVGVGVGVIGIVLAVIGLLGLKKKPVVIEPNNDLENIEKKKQDLDKFIEIKEEYDLRFKEFTDKFPSISGDFITTLFAVRDKIGERQNLVNAISKTENTLKEYAKENYSSVEFSAQVVSVDKLKADLFEKQDTYSELNKLLGDKKSAKLRYDDIVSSIPDLESKRAQLREEEVEFIDRHMILSKTLEFLKIADTNLKTKYREPLENSFNKYVSLISNGKMSGAKIDIDFKVSVEETGGAKEQEYYSKGSRDLFEVCKRFALIDVLFTKEKPFMLLDDPFVSFDETKINFALDLVKKLADEYQIIYFVCHDSRKA